MSASSGTFASLSDPISLGWKAASASSHTDVAALLRKHPGSIRQPLMSDTVHLWLDNLDPHSLSFLRASVIVTECFWAVQLRCFVRVNGVMARVLDTQLTCRLSERPEGSGADSAPGLVVRRQRSWREGSWQQLVGGADSASADAPTHLDLGGVEDRLAARRLPLLRPAVFEVLVLPQEASQAAAPCPPPASPTRTR